MTRNLLYVIALANFDVKFVKFIDADTHLHNFGCAYEDKNNLVFEESSNVMSSRHFRNMLSLDEGETPDRMNYPVIVRTKRRGNVKLHEIQDYVVINDTLLFTEKDLSQER